MQAQAPEKRAISPRKTCQVGDAEPQETEVTTVKVGAYIFQNYYGFHGACLQVVRDGKVIFRRTGDIGMHFTIGQKAENFPADADESTDDRKLDHIPAVPNGTDLTGLGHPNMVVSYTYGGLHCCRAYYVFELEPEFRLVATLKPETTISSFFTRFPDDSRWYFLASDWTFAYWPGSYAGSPHHTVLLCFKKDGAFHLAMDKMHQPAPTHKEWEGYLEGIRKSNASETDAVWSIGDTLWTPVLHLLYTGHSDLAWKLVEEAGPYAKKELPEFCSILKTSPYWMDLKSTIQNMPPPCMHSRPSKH